MPVPELTETSDGGTTSSAKKWHGARIFLLLWQLPQLVLGAAVALALGARRETWRDGVLIMHTKRLLGVSFGPIIIVWEGAGEQTERHELGHSRQSLLLGPLYLLAVGLPSLAMNLASRRSPRIAAGYYRRWPESWADRLGGVDRR
jgi:hypothetical protein